MELLLILIYAAFAIGIFKLFKIPVNGFSLLTAALGGAAMLALLVLSMNYNHPFSSEGRFYFVTTPITPTVSGRVIVSIHFEEDLSKYQIVPGSTGNVAIYTDHMKELGILRKVLLRVKSWMNFIFSDGH